MSDKMRESLSALLDDEANELEFQRLLSRIGDDEQLRQVWTRYNLVRAATSGQRPAHPQLDISARVRQAIAGRAGSGPAPVATADKRGRGRVGHRRGGAGRATAGEYRQ